MLNERERYEAPVVHDLGTVDEMTEAFDKIGSTADVYTPAIPQLDGEVKQD